MRIERQLAAMFEADRSMPAAQWFRQFPMYAVDGPALATKPWWPPLSDVWRAQGKPPSDAPADVRQNWAEAWALLERLHADYEAAKAGAA